MAASDEELLIQQDAASFELFYGRYFERLLAFFAWRTRDAELAADLTSETFAARSLRGGAITGGAGARTRGCSRSRTTSSPIRSDAPAPRIGRAGAWASSASSSPTTTSRASTGWAERAGWPSWCASCPMISNRRSRRV